MPLHLSRQSPQHQVRNQTPPFQQAGEGEGGTYKSSSHRNPLRAHAYGVRGILNVCAKDVLAACSDEACAYAEFAVGAFIPYPLKHCTYWRERGRSGTVGFGLGVYGLLGECLEFGLSKGVG